MMQEIAVGLLAVITVALCVIALRSRVVIQVPPVEIPPAQVVLPHNISVIANESIKAACRIDIGQKQPDGSFQAIGHVDVSDPAEESTWPERLHQELAAPGRAIRLPNSDTWREE
jgi:hypothetical protein